MPTGPTGSQGEANNVAAGSSGYGAQIHTTRTAWTRLVELNKSQNSQYTHSTPENNSLKYNKERPHSPQNRLQRQQRLTCGNRLWITVFPPIVSTDTINLSHQNNADTIWGRTLLFHARGDTGAGASDEAQTCVDDEELTCIAFPNTRRSFATSIRRPASSILASFSLGASLCFAYNVAPIICVGGCGY